MTSSTIVTNSARIWLGNDGIVHIINSPGYKVKLEDAKQNVHAAKKFGDKKRPLYVDITRIESVSKDAREYYASIEAAKRISVCAMVVGSPISKVVGNFFLGLNKPHYPVRLFTSEEEALDWLRNYV
jgi:hypothetical protein